MFLNVFIPFQHLEMFSFTKVTWLTITYFLFLDRRINLRFSLFQKKWLQATYQWVPRKGKNLLYFRNWWGRYFHDQTFLFWKPTKGVFCLFVFCFSDWSFSLLLVFMRVQLKWDLQDLTYYQLRMICKPCKVLQWLY